MAALQQKVLNMIKHFRREWHLFSDSERTTVCGADSMLMILQLSEAEVNKQHSGDFTVSLSNVIATWKYLLHDKLRLLYENMEVPENYTDIRKAYDSSLKRSNMLDLIDIYQKHEALTSEPQHEATFPAQLLEFISGVSDLAEENGSVPCVPSAPTKSHNQDDIKLVKSIIYAYVSLLVNSKNDLALAHILNVPDRGLGREAFTDLKHAAQKRQMPIFLVATSFVRAIELGGKGYAPSPLDPLRTHIKGLADFVHFIDKLEEIVGEVLDPRIAGGRILSTVKMHLIKGQNSGDPVCRAAEEVVQDLDLRIKNIINSQHEAATASTTGISPARPKLHAINHGTVYCGRDTMKSLLILLDEEAAQLPTKNKSELLFGDECVIPFGVTSVLTLFRPARRRTWMRMKQPLIRSQFACTYKDDQMTEKKEQHLFSGSQVPTCMHPAPKQMSIVCFEDEPTAEGVNLPLENPALGTSSGNVQQNGSKSKEMGKISCQPRNKNSKRKQVDMNREKILHSTENEAPQHTNSKRSKTAKKLQDKLDIQVDGTGKSNRAKAKNKLIAGQVKLTHFFRL
uniref:PCNA-interacting partner n=1 Tax=Sphenodon punctatus TaxID=8508 RepID=A0A8D0L5J5_SPHPU